MRVKRNRYAAVGDTNGEAVTGGLRAGEGEKMDKLEREVLEYPGWVDLLFYSLSTTPYRINISLGRFKTAPGIEAAFKAWRLPQSFLVLLESLLNKTPVARPSCERVAGAIWEGKVGCYLLSSFPVG